MHIAEWKTKEIENLTQIVSSHPVVGIVKVSKIPGPQLQKMRQGLRETAVLKVTKNSLLVRALQKAAENINGIEKIGGTIDGETALIATKANPFKLYKEIERTKTKAPAKGGERAQKDIVVEKGETPFKPGPIVGELQNAGIPAAIQGGAVVIKETKTLVKKGDKIPADVAKMLTRLEIYPLEIGLDLRALYEKQIIYSPEILKIDAGLMLQNFQKAAWGSYNLALKIGYATKATITPLLKKAYMDTIFLATHCKILIPETTKTLLTRAFRESQALQLHIKSSVEKELTNAQPEKVEEKKKEPEKLEETTKKQEQTKKTEATKENKKRGKEPPNK